MALCGASIIPWTILLYFPAFVNVSPLCVRSNNFTPNEPSSRLIWISPPNASFMHFTNTWDLWIFPFPPPWGAKNGTLGVWTIMGKYLVKRLLHGVVSVVLVVAIVMIMNVLVDKQLLLSASRQTGTVFALRDGIQTHCRITLRFIIVLELLHIFVGQLGMVWYRSFWLLLS